MRTMWELVSGKRAHFGKIDHQSDYPLPRLSRAGGRKANYKQVNLTNICKALKGFVRF
jgi:hypothetical protein